MKYVRLSVLLAVVLSAFSLVAEAASSSLVFSQVYLGSGEGSSKPRYDFLELFNRGSAAVNLQGWTLQYTMEGSNTWTAYPLSGSLAPGQYFLIRLAATSGTANLPLQDFTINLSPSLGAARFALVNGTTAMDTPCQMDLITDLFGYGTSSCRESLSAPVPLEVQALIRKAGGCQDNDNNFSDFTALTPIARNSASARNFCGAGSTAGTRAFSIPDRGGSTFRTAGEGSVVSVGFARIQADPTRSAPSGVAIYGLRQGGTLITETGVPAAPLVTTGLTYVEITGPANTGIAIANPNSADVTFEYTVSESGNVQNDINGSITIAANSQVARFLTESPFSLRPVVGTLTFRASAPVAVTALRGFTNQRSEFLVSTLPVVDMSSTPSSAVAYVPHFAVNGGWRTDLVLVNRTDVAITGTVDFKDLSGNPLSVRVGTENVSTVEYSIPAKRTVNFGLPNGGGLISQTGSIQVTPAFGQRAPIALGVFSYTSGTVRASEAALSAITGNQFRTYIENSGVAAAVGTIQSGLAIANAGATTATVNVEMFRLDGTSTGLNTSFTIPVGGKTAKFANEIFPSLPNPFQGIMRFTSGTPLAVAGLRGRYNERRDFLITTVPVAEELTQGTSGELIFPQIVDAGGYTTQFVLFNTLADQITSGTILFRTIGGQRSDLNVQ